MRYLLLAGVIGLLGCESDHTRNVTEREPTLLPKGGVADLIWPEVFTNPDFQYGDTESDLILAICDGLTGWGNCHAGAPIPEGFGRGMVKIGVLTGAFTPEELMKIAKALPSSPT